MDFTADMDNGQRFILKTQPNSTNNDSEKANPQKQQGYLTQPAQPNQPNPSSPIQPAQPNQP